MKYFSIIQQANGTQKLHSRTGLSNKETAERLTERLQAGAGKTVNTRGAQSLRDIEKEIEHHNHKVLRAPAMS